MAVTLGWHDILEKYDKVKQYWEDVDEFERFYLRYLQETIADRIYYKNSLEQEVYLDPIDWFPELKEYQIWCEGFRATGQSGKAHLVGTAPARNFRQACNMVMCIQYMANIEKVNSPDWVEAGSQGRWDYNPNALTYWGCSLSWSEKIARKTYG